MQTSSRSSIRDVAERAGVSAVTVSNVLRGRSSRASVETRDRVLAAARALNYVPVAQPATQSRKTRTQVIGLVFDQVSIKDMWGFPTFLGLQAAGIEHGYDLLTVLRAQPEWMPEAEDVRFLDRRTDGFIFVVPKDRYAVLETLVQHRVPAVACFTNEAPPGVAVIMLDNAQAMHLTVGHLVEHGHRRILFVNSNFNRGDFAQRREGYHAAMEDAGLEPLVYETMNQEIGDCPGLFETIRYHGVTAVACSSDAIALRVWEVAEAHGLKVPEQLSITGMDDLPEVANRGLTTVRFSCEEIGLHAVEAILNMGRGVPAAECNRSVPVELVVRTSVALPQTQT